MKAVVVVTVGKAVAATRRTAPPVVATVTVSNMEEVRVATPKVVATPTAAMASNLRNILPETRAADTRVVEDVAKDGISKSRISRMQKDEHRQEQDSQEYEHGVKGRSKIITNLKSGKTTHRARITFSESSISTTRRTTAYPDSNIFTMLKALEKDILNIDYGKDA